MAYTGQKLATGATITESWISDTIDGIDGSYTAINALTNTTTALNTRLGTAENTINSLTQRVDALENAGS